MAQEFVARYKKAEEPPPRVLYLDRDCWAIELFSPWYLEVRLDIWLFTRCFSVGVNTDSHTLYGVFLARLSACIFQLDAGDLAELRAAKKSELQLKRGVTPTQEQVDQAITKEEMDIHCQRQTRGGGDSSRVICPESSMTDSSSSS